MLHALNPKLVMVRLSGFGQTGPMKDQPGFGAVGESMGGLRYITGFEDRLIQRHVDHLAAAAVDLAVAQRHQRTDHAP